MTPVARWTLVSLALPVALVLAAAPSASAQATAVDTAPPARLDGRFLAGVSFARVMTTHDDLGSQTKVSPYFRWNSQRHGWGPSFGFSWSTVELRVPVAGRTTTIGDVRLRPVMAGIGYSTWRGPVRANAGLVAGYAFNRAEVRSGLPPGTTASLTIDRAWAAGPKAELMWAVTRRLAVIGSAAYVFSNPRLTAHVWTEDRVAYERVSRIRGDALSLRIGAAVSLF